MQFSKSDYFFALLHSYVAVPSLDQGRRNEPIFFFCELHINDGQIVLITDAQNYVTFPILLTLISLLAAVA